MAYTATLTPSGTYQIKDATGTNVSTGSAAILANYGLSVDNLGGTPATSVTSPANPTAAVGAAFSSPPPAGLTPAQTAAYQNVQAAFAPPPPSPVPATTLNQNPTLAPVAPGSVASPYPVASLTVPTVATPTLGPEQSKAQALANEIAGLRDSTVGKTAFQTEQNTKFGVDAANATVTDLGKQLTALKNEAAAIPLQLQQGAADRGVTTPVLGKQENSRLRTNAIAALGVSTLLAAAQGDLAHAQNLADKAVAEKYGPIEEAIAAKVANYNMIINSPLATLEEKKQATELLASTQAQANAVANQKTAATEIWKVATDSAQNIANFKPTAQYASASLALDAISKAPTPEAALAIAVATGMTKDVTAAINNGTWSDPYTLGGNYVQKNSVTGEIRTAVNPDNTTTGGGTAAERASVAFTKFQAAFVPGAKLPNGIPVLDAEGYLTPEAFKSAIADASSLGLSREQFLQQFGYLMVTADGTISPNYGLTPAEIAILKATLRA